MQYHKSVLLKESVDALEVSNGGVFVDVTYGGGGHSREILRRAEGCSLYSFDATSLFLLFIMFLSSLYHPYNIFVII